jgi:hypothetical protein
MPLRICRGAEEDEKELLLLGAWGILEPRTLDPQALVLRAQPLAFGLQPLLLIPQGGVLVLKSHDASTQPAQVGWNPTGVRASRLPRHEARSLQPPYRHQEPAISIQLR